MKGMITMSTAALLLLLTTSPAATQTEPAVDVTVLENGKYAVRLLYSISDFETEALAIDGQKYVRVVLPGEAKLMPAGAPDLPSITRSLVVPEGAAAEVQVLESAYREYDLRVAPVPVKLSRTMNLVDEAYEFSTAYNEDRYIPEQLVEIGTPHILRDLQGVTVTVHPFAYNGRTHTLRVYERLVVEVGFSGGAAGDVPRLNEYFCDIYRNHYLNFESGRYTIVGEQGRMVVISHADFLTAAQSYVDWKNQKGIPTALYDVADVGATESEVRSFLQSEYDLADGLTFVQFVGDAEHVPTFLIEREFCDGLATSDALYSLLAGNDGYPDIFVGRFSAATVADVETQVERTIWYERDLAAGEWLHKGCGVGSAWGEGYGYLGLRDRDLVEVLRQMLLGYTYTDVDQLYEWGEPPFGIIPVPVEDFVNALNDGRGIVIVEGHADCEATFMVPPGTFEDVFTTDSVYTLVNDYMLPFMSLGAPYLGNFQIGETYPEAWLRATNSVTGAPIGAIAVYASSTDLDYASPQAAQHEMVELLTADKLRSFGGLMYNGACLAVDLYAQRGERTFLSFHILGDASLQVRTDSPSAMQVLHESEIMTGLSSFEVEVVDQEGALCALSRDAELLGCAYCDGRGVALIEFAESLTGEGPLDLFVTDYNYITYSAEITVTPFICGDADANEIVNVSDAVYLISYIFGGGPEPVPYAAGDVDCNDIVNVSDVVYLIAYIFAGGPEPCIGCP